METKIIKVDRDKLKFNKDYYDAAFNEAAIIINKGGLVAFPTETVYGLGADATNPFASKRIYEAKGRPSDNPLIIHIYDLEQIKDYAREIPEIAYVLAKRFWPGPLTMILKKKDIIPRETSGGLDTVGIRMPSDEVAREFLKYTSVAVAAPSANKSGRPSPTLASHVYEDMNNKILCPKSISSPIKFKNIGNLSSIPFSFFNISFVIPVSSIIFSSGAILGLTRAVIVSSILPFLTFMAANSIISLFLTLRPVISKSIHT